MPKKQTGRKFLKGNIDEANPLSTLADGAVVKSDFDETVNERSLVTSIEATWNLRSGTVGQGPIIVGIAHSDYTAAEIQEVIDNTGSWNEGDKVQQEVAKRLVRIIGSFPGDLADEDLNDGKPVKTRLNWVLLQGQTLSTWALNKSGATLTTGTLVINQGHANIKPL